jgi:hypothetical protein
MTNKMQLCRINYYSLAAVHVSSEVFAYHQEHLTVLQLLVLHRSIAASRQRHTCEIPEAVIQFRCS